MLSATMRKGWGKLTLAVLGSLIYAVGINVFMVPLGLYTGGMLGLAQLLRTLLLNALGGITLPIDLAGVILYAFNIPLGHVLPVHGQALLPKYPHLLHHLRPVHQYRAGAGGIEAASALIHRCLLGGVISGVGTGLVLTCGCCGGGLDALGLIIAKRGARITVGQVNLVFNAVLFSLYGLLFNVETMIYSILNTVFQAVAIDRAHQQSVNVQVLIFTKVEDPDFHRFIMEDLHRGVTRWEGKGAFTGENTHILCLSKYEIDDLRQALHRADPHAFFIIQEGVQVSNNFERRLS